MKNIVPYEHLMSHVNEAENTYQAIKAKKDFDHFNTIVVPAMKSAGFKRVTEPVNTKERSSYGAGYFCYPDHNTGVNLFLDTPFSSHWKYVVFRAGNKDVKEFGWKTGTDAEVKKAATDAVNYAIKLKNQNFKKINEEYTANEEMDNTEPKDSKAEANKNWPAIESALKNINPCKVIKMQDGDVSLNWGLYQGPNGKGGFSIAKNGSFNFHTGLQELYNMVVKYMTDKGMEIPKFSGLNKKSGTYQLYTGQGYIWNYEAKDLIDVAKFIATKVSAR